MFNDSPRDVNILHDLSQFLYDVESLNIPDTLGQYIKFLKSTGNVIDAQNATMQTQYQLMITDTNFLEYIKDCFNKIFNELTKMGIFFALDGRRKSLLSFENKVQLAIKNGKCLDSIHDIFAFRIILFEMPNKPMIEECYKVLDNLTIFLSQNGFLPCEAQKNISSKSLYIKDYIEHPKESGYQSLHMIFSHPSTGHYFEVQIRTLTMHAIAERGTASHLAYKRSKYSFQEPFDQIDLNKVNLIGFYYSEKDDVYTDQIGFTNSINIMTRLQI